MMFPKPMPRLKEKPSKLGARKEPRRGPRRDPLYRAKVRRLKCAAIGMPGHVCGGRIECDHMGVRGLGQKCHDDESGPMCQVAHCERTNYVGTFKNYTARMMREFCDGVIAKTRARLDWVPPLRGDEP